MTQILLNLSYAIFVVYFDDVMVIGRSLQSIWRTYRKCLKSFVWLILSLSLKMLSHWH